MSDAVHVCNPGITIMQGDSWPLEFRLLFNGLKAHEAGVEAVEFSVDKVIKRWPGQVQYVEETGFFYMPFTQEETFRLRGQCRAQARVTIKGSVIGIDLAPVQIIPSNSKEVL